MQSFIIECLILNSLICWGAYFAFMEGNVLHPVRKLIEWSAFAVPLLVYTAVLVFFIFIFALMVAFKLSSVASVISFAKALFSTLIDATEWLIDYLSNPLWDCVMCMASVWGVSFLLVLGPENVTGEPLYSFHTVLYLFALCGLNWFGSMIAEYLASSNNKNTV